MNASTLTADIVTFPFKFKVKRSHADFRSLREYLLKRYPQTIIPPLPPFNEKKQLTPR